MDTILSIVQIGLLLICVVCGVTGVVLLVIDHRKPKHKTTDCVKCEAFFPLEMGYGRCAYTNMICTARQRACHWEHRGM